MTDQSINLLQGNILSRRFFRLQSVIWRSAIVVAVVLANGCREQNPVFPRNDDSGVITINIADNIKNSGDVKLSDIATDIEYVKLEMTDESALMSIYDAHVTDDYIFVNSARVMRLLQFDRQGKFIRAIGETGRGPGEYMEIKGLAFDDENGIIYINSNWIHKIVKYDYNGTYLGDIPLDNWDDTESIGTYSWYIDLIGTNNIVVHRGFGVPLNAQDYYDFVVIDTAGDFEYIKNTAPYTDLSEETASERVSLNYKWKLNNSIMVLPVGNDTVFEINPTGVRERYYLDLGELKFPPDLLYNIELRDKNLEKYIFGLYCFETDDFLFTRFLYDQKYYVGRYNKQAGDLRFKSLILPVPGTLTAPFDSGLTNDIDGGINIWPRDMGKYYGEAIDPIDMIDYFNEHSLENRPALSQEKRDNFKAFLESLDENDNPVLMLLKTEDD